MTSKERVLRTLEFNAPDQIPVDLWILPAAKYHYGEKLDKLLDENSRDIISMVGPFDHGFTPAYYQKGEYTDPWGSVWLNLQPGVIGEVKDPVIKEYSMLDDYTSPLEQFKQEWEENEPTLIEQIEAARKKEKFVIGGWISLFERLQFLRGTEELYCDIALQEKGMFQLIERVMEYMHLYLDKWLAMDIDAVTFGDDWGSQISLLIAPDQWRSVFRPLYKELIDRIKADGKKVFFHSDGYIMDLYPEFIKLGVDAINSQLWCMDVEEIASKYAGKITFWGEISRQDTLPNGTPADIQHSADAMKEHLYVNNGGLIGQSEVGADVPLENIETVLRSWNK